MERKGLGRSQIWEDVREATELINSKIDCQPSIGIVLGSGLASLAGEVDEAKVMPYHEIPHFPLATVHGHQGELVVGTLEGKNVALMCGRAHFYEGYSMFQITLPIRVMGALGVEALIATNAAGGLAPSFQVGDLMLITDHINLIGLAGFSPLRGLNDPRLGPRFLDMSQAYDARLREIAQQAAKDLGLPLKQGIYAMVAGPTFETQAEVRFLRMMGAEAVGMSTVPEVIAARHEGMRVLGISHISNVVVEGDPEQGVSHEKVLAAGEAIVPRLIALIKGIIRRL